MVMVMHDRLQLYCGRSSVNNFPFESLLSFSVFRFVSGTACFINDRVTDHCPRLTNVIALASDSLELESPSNMELLCAAEEGSNASAAGPEAPGASSSMSLAPADNPSTGNF